MPLTYVVILIFGGLTLLTLAADIVNPIRLPLQVQRADELGA